MILTLIGLIRTITSVKKLLNLLESYNLQQHIKNLTHKSGHLLDYIISEKQLINAVSVSDFISDHSALHATMACTRIHPGTKKIIYRCTKKIDSDELSNDISNIDFKTDFSWIIKMLP